ncbi:hypothetical protein KP509_24G056800 [Ceratopteris richardii]|uniref:Serine/threonine-protein phosphatase 4 regulatory subunit 2 n=1 Tax=Ceratopteris richardii TaxID=49495 RepID=A0A8T2RXM7_CERRI|nr:hypothetical protein KP509_24G056800 [Ceratopteris richardii]
MEVEMELPGAGSLGAFYAADDSELKFTDEMKDILEVIAITGSYWHEWLPLKRLLSFRLKQVLTEYYNAHIASGGQQNLISGESFNGFLTRLLETLDAFVDGPPFTLQRFCELLLNPRQTYPNIDKVSLAFEKLLLVTSTIPICKDPYPSNEKEGRRQTPVGTSVHVSVENGSSESRPVSDEDMPDTTIKEGKQLVREDVPDEEASLSLENKTKGAAKDPDSMTDAEKLHGSMDTTNSMGEELVDIPLGDQNPMTND